MSNVVLVSGGVDSFITAQSVLKMDPGAVLLFVDYGQEYAREELAAVRDQFQMYRDGVNLRTVEVRGLSAPKYPDVFMGGRNLMLATLAANHGSVIWLGGLLDDNCADKTGEAFNEMSRLLTAQCGMSKRVVSMFFDQCKHEIVNEYIQGPDKADRMHELSRTFSCYNPHRLQPCHKCEACYRRSVALSVNGISAPVIEEEVVFEYLSRLHLYHPRRQWAMLKHAQNRRPVWSVDIDGVLCSPLGIDYSDKSPNLEALLSLRKAARSKYIILNTSRPEVERCVTIDWLEKYGIPYNSLLMNKIPANVYVDDLSTSRL